MVRTFKSVFVLIIFMLFAWTPQARAQIRPAELKIENKTVRTLEFKVMVYGTNKRFKQDSLSSGTSKTLLIPKTGTYYLKVKARFPGREPVYSKGDPFKMEVDSDGYSVFNITYLMEEGFSDPLGGTKIGEVEFNKN